jgi:hypothetical protein
MSKVMLRPTVAADLAYVVGEPLPCRIRAITALVSDRIIGIGGIAFPPHGPAVAFVQLAPVADSRGDGPKAPAEAGKYPVSFHRAGLMAMKMIRESGLREVIATADTDSQVALRWLKRLGFRALESQQIAGKTLFVWKRGHGSEEIRVR